MNNQPQPSFHEMATANMNDAFDEFNRVTELTIITRAEIIEGKVPSKEESKRYGVLMMDPSGNYGTLYWKQIPIFNFIRPHLTHSKKPRSKHLFNIVVKSLVQEIPEGNPMNITLFIPFSAK